MVVTAPDSETSPRSFDDNTLFGALQRAHRDGDPGRRALAGLRNADAWVELSYDDLMADILTVSTNLSALGLERGEVLSLQLRN